MAETELIGGKRILLVDDEPDVLDTLEDLLPMCETVKASNFKAAKEFLETEYFDMTILDIMGVEGFQLLEIATQREVTAVMLTAHALSPDNIVKSYKEGAASTWGRWYDKLGSFFERKFGEDWQKDEKEFWENFPYY
jgi:DNA-binding NtrC family response regulator